MVKLMALFDSIKKLFGGTPPAPTPVRRPTPPPMMDDEPEPVVPEVSVPDLLAEIQAGGTPTILTSERSSSGTKCGFRGSSISP